MNLRESLLQHVKPSHQFYDESSLEWLFSNRPKFLPRKYKISPQAKHIVQKIKPWNQCDDIWFTNRLIRDGIHGFRHASRVAIYAICLAVQHHHLSDSEINALMFAGLYHDCRRKNDNTDVQHGVRAGIWLSKNINNVVPRNLTSFVPAIRFCISVHNDPYEHIFKKVPYKKFKLFVDLLKTADALDRYRFPRSDWWMSKKFIVLAPRVEEMAFAFDFTSESEASYLKNRDNRKAIDSTWKKTNPAL